MRYREYRPRPALETYVRVLWTLEHTGEAPAADRILPDGCMELVFHLGQPFRAIDHAGRAATQPDAFLVGQMTSALRVRPPRARGSSACASTRAGPSRSCAAAARADGRAARARRRLARAGARAGAPGATLPDMASVVARVEDVLSRAPLARVGPTGAWPRRWPPSPAPAAPLQSTACRLSAAWARASSSGSSASGWAWAPRRLARIVRFQAGLRAQEAGASLSAAAHAAGYADQAHFAREFKAIAGVTPSAFASGEDPLAAAFAGGEPHVGFVQDAAAARA